MVEIIVAVLATALVMGAWVLRTREKMAATQAEVDGQFIRAEDAKERAEQSHAVYLASAEEVRRLTDVIVQLKSDGYDAPPWAGNQDEHWGSYAIDNETELEEEKRREREALARADDEFREELEDL